MIANATRHSEVSTPVQPWTATRGTRRRRWASTRAAPVSSPCAGAVSSSWNPTSKRRSNRTTLSAWCSTAGSRWMRR